MQLYEREIADQNEQIKTKEQTIESYQGIIDANQNDRDIEDVSDLLYKDAGDKVEAFEKELQQYQLVNKNLLAQVS